jgi:hypothetical protein
MRIWFALILILFTATAFAGSDLQLRSIEYLSSDERVIANVYNYGPDTATGTVRVVFYESDSEIGRTTANRSIAAGKSYPFFIEHALLPGGHVITAQLEGPGEMILENNAMTSRITIAGQAEKEVVSDETQKLRASGIYIGEVVIALALILFFAVKVRGMHWPVHRTERLQDGRSLAGMFGKAGKEEMHEKKKENKARKNQDHKNDEIYQKIKSEVVKDDGSVSFEIVMDKGARKKEEQAREQKEAKPPAKPVKTRVEIKETKEGFRPAETKKIKDLIGLPKGTRASASAKIAYYDKIGDMFAYFLSDETDEMIGFSKEKIECSEAVVSGSIDYFMNENTVLVIDKCQKL